MRYSAVIGDDLKYVKYFNDFGDLFAFVFAGCLLICLRLLVCQTPVFVVCKG